MICGSCDRRNRDGARFCRYCATKFELRCRRCATTLEDDSLFCDGCGAPVEALGPPVEDGSEPEDEDPEPASGADAVKSTDRAGPAPSPRTDPDPDAHAEPHPEPEAEPEPEPEAEAEPEPHAEDAPASVVDSASDAVAAAAAEEPDVSEVEAGDPQPIEASVGEDIASDATTPPSSLDVFPHWEPSGSWVADNIASKMADQALHRLLERDWDAFLAAHSPKVQIEDRRAGLLWVGTGRDAVLKRAGDYASADRRVTTMRLATWGDRLVLARQILTRGNEGHWESQRLVLTGIDERGSIIDVAYFDAHDLTGAMGVLSRKFTSGEGREWADILTAQELLDVAYDKRDWKAFGNLHDASVFLVDHRAPGAPSVSGRDEMVARSKSELTTGQHPVLTEIIAIEMDRVLTRHHVLVVGADIPPDEADSLTLAVWRGGRLKHIERFPVWHVKAALERFDRLGTLGPTPDLGLENACTQAVNTSQGALDEGDAKRAGQAYDGRATVEDRRGEQHIVCRGRKQMASLVELYRSEASAPARLETLAIRGERLALTRRCLVPTSGRGIEHEEILVNEIAGDGHLIASIVFAADAIDAAFDELDARYAAGEASSSSGLPTPPYRTIHREREWDAWTAALGNGFALIDHRTRGWGELDDAEDFTEIFRTQTELSPEARFWDVAIYAVGEHGTVGRYRMTRVKSEGGAIDVDFVLVARAVEDGLHLEIFPIDRLADAIARSKEPPSEPTEVRQAS